MTEHDAKGLEIIAGWLQRDGLIEPAAMLRRLAAGASEGQAEEFPEVEQDWAQVEPSVAFHLIERHAENWAHAGQLMESWRTATTSAEIAALRERIAGMEARLKIANDCYARLMQACSDAGCPDGVRMDDWIRERIAGMEKDVEKRIPDGWRFYTADFSVSRSPGSVTLIRDDKGKAAWLALSDEERETTDLHVFGRGKTFSEAIDAAIAAIAKEPK